MKLDLILVIGLIVNTIFAVLYPAQIFGEDPLGLSGESGTELQSYYSVDSAGFINSYNSTTGELTTNNDIFTNIEGAVTSTDGDAGILTTEVFGFVDWVKTGFNLIKTMVMFVVGFIYLLLTLSYPFNILIGVPFAALYTFSIASYIIGRF